MTSESADSTRTSSAASQGEDGETADELATELDGFARDTVRKGEGHEVWFEFVFGELLWHDEREEVWRVVDYVFAPFTVEWGEDPVEKRDAKCYRVSPLGDGEPTRYMPESEVAETFTTLGASSASGEPLDVLREWEPSDEWLAEMRGDQDDDE